VISWRHKELIGVTSAPPASPPDPVYVYFKGKGWIPKIHVVRLRVRTDILDNYPLDWNVVCTTCSRPLGDHFGYFRDGQVTCELRGERGFTW
jgi:hypothetical protein